MRARVRAWLRACACAAACARACVRLWPEEVGRLIPSVGSCITSVPGPVCTATLSATSAVTRERRAAPSNANTPIHSDSRNSLRVAYSFIGNGRCLDGRVAAAQRRALRRGDGCVPTSKAGVANNRIMDTVAEQKGLGGFRVSSLGVEGSG